MEKKRVNFMIPDDLLNRIDQEADRLSLNRTSMLIVALNSYLEQRDILKAFDSLESLKQLTDLKNAKLLNGGEQLS